MRQFLLDEAGESAGEYNVSKALLRFQRLLTLTRTRTQRYISCYYVRVRPLQRRCISSLLVETTIVFFVFFCKRETRRKKERRKERKEKRKIVLKQSKRFPSRRSLRSLRQKYFRSNVDSPKGRRFDKLHAYGKKIDGLILSADSYYNHASFFITTKSNLWKTNDFLTFFFFL